MFGDATTLPFPDDSFDLVLAIEVLEHVPGPTSRSASCRGCARARSSRRCRSSRSGGPATSPAGRYVRQLGNTPGHVNHWTRWGFQRFVASRFHVQQTCAPLPWTMVRAIPH